MGPDHAEIYLQLPPVPVQNLDALVQHPTAEHAPEKIAPDDMLLLGMMLYMEQGMVLEWLQPQKDKGTEEDANREDNVGGHSHE